MVGFFTSGRDRIGHVFPARALRGCSFRRNDDPASTLGRKNIRSLSGIIPLFTSRPVRARAGAPDCTGTNRPYNHEPGAGRHRQCEPVGSKSTAADEHGMRPIIRYVATSACVDGNSWYCDSEKTRHLRGERHRSVRFRSCTWFDLTDPTAKTRFSRARQPGS
jgi:hypothetical protein